MPPRLRPCVVRPWAFLVLIGAGGVEAQESNDRWAVTVTANVVGQATSEDDIRSELVASLDVFSDVRLGPVSVHAYVEGNTTPRDEGVSERLPFSNMDARTALDRDGKGRVQISELRFAWPVRDDLVLHAGLMDLTGYLDVSRIANDENLFFLAQPFVNNPTIVFPDYTIAGTLIVGLPRLPKGELAVSLASSHGLADDPAASYGRLFETSAEDRGIFVAGRLRFDASRWRGSLGAWASSGERAGQLGEPLPHRGIFSLVGVTLGGHALSGRLGVAEGDVGRESFFGLTYLGEIGSNALGVGAAIGPALPELVARRGEHVEAFVRRSIRGVLYLTSSVQWLSGGFFPEVDADHGAWIFGFRVSATL